MLLEWVICRSKCLTASHPLQLPLMTYYMPQTWHSPLYPSATSPSQDVLSPLKTIAAESRGGGGGKTIGVVPASMNGLYHVGHSEMAGSATTDLSLLSLFFESTIVCLSTEPYIGLHLLRNGQFV